MRNLFQRLLVILNFKRTENIARLILPFIKKGERVLDLGAGSGKIAEFIKIKREVEITLLDVSSRYNQTKLKVVVYDGSKIPFKDNSFDAVLVIFVLHHSKNPDLTLREAIRVSKNKVIIFEDIFETKLGFLLTYAWDVLVNSIILGEKISLKFRSDKNWKRSFKDLGLEVVFEKEVRLPFFRPTPQKLYVLERV